MKRTVIGLFVLGAAISVAVSSVDAQRRTTRSTARNKGQNGVQSGLNVTGAQPVIDPKTGLPVIDPKTGLPMMKNQKDTKEEKGPDLPGDPQLLRLHQEFVAKTAKLAKDYERQGETEKAGECYERILKLIPRLPEAEQALAKIKEKQLNAEKKRMVVNANGGWQDTGIELIPGKPVAIEAQGSWTFRMSNELGPDGMKIPEELRDFNLGSLIGVIGSTNIGKDGPKPFLIGENVEFTPEKGGRLYVRMYDSDPSDNAGKLNVEIHGTFGRGR